MGLLDIFKKNKPEEKPVAPQVEPEEVEAVGWDAIEKEFLRVYPGQENPKHYGTVIKWMLGGKNPLDGISVYDGGDYWHFVSFGQTEIYEKECDNKEISGYGYELTFKLKKADLEDEEAELRNICGILQMVARITFTKGELFAPDEFIYTGQTQGIDAFQKSNLTGFICVKDPTVETIDTPNGRVEFLELVGMTDAELKTLSNKASVAELYAKLGSDVTDYHRESIV
ncbi:MAG: suppressor of fused domain protein [Lachnospiraceae bacterium]|nr:suppressor of fused domain protein [Lachnospiraceae bacterium]